MPEPTVFKRGDKVRITIDFYNLERFLLVPKGTVGIVTDAYLWHDAVLVDYELPYLEWRTHVDWLELVTPAS